jgi:hypothetical protein
MQIIESTILSKLSENDDFDFWRTFLETWSEDFEIPSSNKLKSYEIFLEIGSCSHWVRPNQTRLTTAGGFAYPVGYGGNGGYGDGEPEFDWSVLFSWNKDTNNWETASKYSGKKKFVCRVALPNRTKLHPQAVANVVWKNGTPKNPSEKLKLYYAFRKVENIWKLISSDNL